MNIAGIAEFILGNTYPFVVFVVYGCHWVNLGYTSDPAHPLSAGYGADGALSQAFNCGQGNYYVVMTLVSCVFLVGSIRINLPFVLIFFAIVFVFSFIAAANYEIGYNPTTAGLERAAYLLKIAGGFGMVIVLTGL